VILKLHAVHAVKQDPYVHHLPGAILPGHVADGLGMCPETSRNPSRGEEHGIGRDSVPSPPLSTFS